MVRLSAIRLLLTIALLAPFVVRAAAQDDTTETPLGDVARNFRKKTPPTKPVIDDDNLPQVMQEADSHKDFGQSLRFLMSGDSRGFQVAAPDVTCSLSFTANAKSLLSSQFDQMELPAEEMGKIEGKAVVEGDALTVPVFNGTQWHLSEITVAFTVVRKGKAVMRADQEALNADPSRAATGDSASDAFQQVRPEKKPDFATIYRMRAAALPWSNAVFSAPLKLEIAPGEEWHWAIVQAKGYPPETYVSTAKPTFTEPASHEPVPATVSLKSAETENAGSIPEQSPK